MTLAWTSTIMGGHIHLSSDAEALIGFDVLRQQVKLTHQARNHRIKLHLASLLASGELAADNAPADVIAEVEGYDVPVTQALLAETEADVARLQADAELAPVMDRAKMALGVGMHRRFARGRKGYYALVPARGEKGDEIVIFKGGCMPILVRGKREIVGECYVQGVMQGEVWREEGCEEFVIY
ncbi:hypothetical protein VTI74DRAFT_9924 [Chaetomium olivicolor]